MVKLVQMIGERDGFGDILAEGSEKASEKLGRGAEFLITAKGQEVDRQKGLEMGADRYMTKPFDPDEMLSVAEEILNT